MVETRSRTAGKQAASGGPVRKAAAPAGVSKPKQRSNGKPAARRGKTKTTSSRKEAGGGNDKVHQVVKQYGDVPLKGLVDEKWPKDQVVLAHIFNALLSSTRISHDIAVQTLACLLDENYQDLDTLSETTWEARTEVLTKGGYTHYREKTATFLGELAELLKDKYDGDASKIIPEGKKGEAARSSISDRLQEIKGLGQVGIGIFLGSIQHVFPTIAPFLDPRSLKTAEQIGLGGDADAIFAGLGHDALAMAKLEVALTKVRLEKREKEFT